MCTRIQLHEQRLYKMIQYFYINNMKVEFFLRLNEYRFIKVRE